MAKAPRADDHGFPRLSAAEIPWLTVEQMAQADRLAMGRFNVDLLQMMELAGSAMAELTTALAPEGAVTVLAGGGNNGGGGLAAARHLINRGRAVEVVLATETPNETTRHQLATLNAMGVAPVAEPSDRAVVIDALVGYGLHGRLMGASARHAGRTHGRTVFSLDFPSGHGFEGAVEATATLTLALPKEGLATLRPLFIADLGLPTQLWAAMELEVGHVFADGRIVEIVDALPLEY
jgi:NAD(P)H-hydrate epimerase